MKRFSLRVTGCVQGVGFRPFVARLAARLGLSGWVQNSEDGVCIEVQGNAVEQFIAQLNAQAPPLANIDYIEQTQLAIKQETQFSIKPSSPRQGTGFTPADSAICTPCLDDCFNPYSRFYLYPFVSCTDCGPRQSIIDKSPYDREHTSFSTFTMCHHCQRDYNDSQSRRYHAQTIACPQCGPQLSQSIEQAAQAIKRGLIVAVKSMHGFHLIADGSNEQTIAKLRQRKKRPCKPFALMMLNQASAEQYLQGDNNEFTSLVHPARPIVLLAQKNKRLPELLAPGLNQLGVMLPGTALHYLLFYHLLGKPQHSNWLSQPNEIVLIATSANVSGMPLIIDNDGQQSVMLAQLADVIIDHDLTIEHRLDDSVIIYQRQQRVFIRRSKGYVPEPIELPHAIEPTLALGSLFKNTVCLTRDNMAFLSPVHGDLSDYANLQWAQQSIEKLGSYLGVDYQQIIIDKHPQHPLLSWADSQQKPLITIQHHRAHSAQVMAEYTIDNCLSLVLDGFGLGDDNSAWGGELFYCDGADISHVDQLAVGSLPGGDKAAIECWRMALACLIESQNLPQHLNQYPQALIQQMINQEINSPVTSSMGRLFDAAASILNCCQLNSYDGEAAMRLQAQVKQAQILPEGWQQTAKGLSFHPLLKFLLQCDPKQGADYFHGTLIAGLSQWLSDYASTYQVNTLVLSGGCFHNQILAQGLIDSVKKQGITAYLSSLPNDSGLSLGQAWLGGQNVFSNTA